MPQFQIESYRVNVRRATPSRRRIELVSEAEFHGIRHRATLWFRDPGELPSSMGTAFNFGGLNFNGVTVVAYLPLSDFADMHRMLQQEKPVFLNYGVSSSDSTTRPLTHIEIGTQPEPLGEGPSDRDFEDSTTISGLTRG